VGKKVKYIRDMSDPTRCQQPKTYQGEFWADPNSEVDNGGVHTNSGPGNYLFYNVTQTTSRDFSLNLFVNVLKNIPQTCNYLQYRDAMKKQCPPEQLPQVQNALNLSGLTDSIVNDWNP